MLAVIGSIFLMAGCSGGFISPPPASPPQKNTGTVQIYLGKVPIDTRTLLPSRYDIAMFYFVLTFTPQEGEEIVIILDEEDIFTIQLPVGEWILDVKGYLSEEDAEDPENMYIGGTKAVVISGGINAPIEVILSPVNPELTQDAEGILSYHITIPDEAMGVLEVFDLDPLEETIIESVSFSATEFNTGRLLIDSGFYYVRVTVKYEGFEKVWRELAHIYDNAVTEAVIEYIEDDFVNSDTAAITQFGFSIPNVYTMINENTRAISIIVPPKADISALTPVIRFDGVMIIPPSYEYLDGPADFTAPVIYRVYSEDGKYADFTVSVSGIIYDTAILAAYLESLPVNTADDPFPVKVNVNLDLWWTGFLNALGAGRYVDMDISDSTGMETLIPGAGTTGKNMIVSLELPLTTTAINAGTSGNPTFNYFTSLETISGANVSDIGNYAFYNRTSLKTFDLPVVETIGNSVFSGCTGLTDIIIPDSVISAGTSVFSGCTGLTAAIFTDTVRNWAPVFLNTAELTVILEDGVTGIGDSAFSDCTGLISVTMPDGVTGIGESAFSGCTGLADVSMPEGVTSIGASAFSGCAALTGIAIPQSVTGIGNLAFSGCTELAAINVAYGNIYYSSVDGLLYNDDITTLILCPQGKAGEVILPSGLTAIAASALSGCAKLNAVTIPQYVAAIGNNAFSGCVNIAVTVYTNIVRAWSPVFADAAGLTVNLTNNVTGIDQDAFTGCTGLIAISIPDGITGIGISAFSGCTGLYSITIPSKITRINDSVFSGCTRLVLVMIPDNITSIGDSVFSGCTGLRSVSIPASVTSIGTGVFSGCTDLRAMIYTTAVTVWSPVFTGAIRLSVTLGSAVINIAASAFSGCTGLTSISFSNYMTSIGNTAFQNCTSLGSVTIPDSVTTIGTSVFAGCTALRSINIPYRINNIGNTIISGCTNIAVTVNAASVRYWNPVLNGATGLTIIFGNSITNIWDYTLQNNTALTGVTITSGITSIGNYAFNGCTSLVSASIPGSVENIGNFAFAGCTALTSAAMASGIVTIGNSAFSGCTRLNNVTIPGSVYSIGTSAFSGCSALSILTIGAGVSQIGISSFQNTNITSVTLPSSISAIGASAFAGCNRLSSVTFGGAIYYANFTNNSSFPGNLRITFYWDNGMYGTPGTYAAADPGQYAIWVKK